jgi:hypothetical protein
MDQRDFRVNFLTKLRYNLYKATHRGREPWDYGFASRINSSTCSLKRSRYACVR